MQIKLLINPAAYTNKGGFWQYRNNFKLWVLYQISQLSGWIKSMI